METGRETPAERDVLKRMKREAVQLCSDVLVGLEPRWLFLCGRSGVGKTHLADRIAAFLQKWGEWAYNKRERPKRDPSFEHYETTYAYAQTGAVSVKWSKIVDMARDGDFSEYNACKNDVYKVIDDLGAEGFGPDRKPTPFVVNQLGKLADARIGKWTVWTSNFMKRDFAEIFDVRIASRMLREGNVIVEVDARDYNIRAQ